MRCFRATEKGKNKIEFRKLDQVLKYKDAEGKERSVNSSCMDMDKQMTRLFGVSGAVLENVIFCHQEETLWPFSDQGHLKKIFDEIFETEKYTRILQETRQEIKNYKNKKKSVKCEYDIRNKDFNICKKIIKTVEESKDKLIELEREARNSQIDIEANNKKLEEHLMREEELKRIESELQLERFQAQQLQSQSTKFITNSHYKDLKKTKEELMIMLNGLEDICLKNEEKKSLIEKEQKNIKQQLTQLEEELIHFKTKKSSIEETLRQQASLVSKTNK